MAVKTEREKLRISWGTAIFVSPLIHILGVPACPLPPPDRHPCLPESQRMQKRRRFRVFLLGDVTKGTLTMTLSCVVSNIFNVKKCCDPEIGVSGHSRSLKVVPNSELRAVKIMGQLTNPGSPGKIAVKWCLTTKTYNWIGTH